METEVKIEVSDLASIRDRLSALGARYLSTVEEENAYFDRDGELETRGQSLRLRQDQRVRLTWKGQSDFRDGVVVRPEVEIAVSSFADAAAILDCLGFQPTERLEKHRETWRLRDVEVALDSLSFGHFVELEGERGSIEAVARELGLDVREGIGVSYRKLRRQKRSADGV